MTKETLAEAQDYLTMDKDGVAKRIVDISLLMKKHTPKEIISFLQDYAHEKEKALRNLILIDKTLRKVDEYAAALFRLHMAIKTLEEGLKVICIANRKGVTTIEQSQQRAKESGKLRQRDSGGNHGTGSRENGSHDAKNRPARNPAQRAA